MDRFTFNDKFEHKFFDDFRAHALKQGARSLACEARTYGIVITTAEMFEVIDEDWQVNGKLQYRSPDN